MGRCPGAGSHHPGHPPRHPRLRALALWPTGSTLTVSHVRNNLAASLAANTHAAASANGHRIFTQNIVGGFGDTTVLKGISLSIAHCSITAIMGPSGCGKSTFIRCINRLHEEIPRAWVTGKIILDGQDIYGDDVDPVAIRRKIGMVF